MSFECFSSSGLRHGYFVTEPGGTLADKVAVLEPAATLATVRRWVCAVLSAESRRQVFCRYANTGFAQANSKIDSGYPEYLTSSCM
jgi:hypothetical protein